MKTRCVWRKQLWFEDLCHTDLTQKRCWEEYRKSNIVVVIDVYVVSVGNSVYHKKSLIETKTNICSCFVWNQRTGKFIFLVVNYYNAIAEPELSNTICGYAFPHYNWPTSMLSGEVNIFFQWLCIRLSLNFYSPITSKDDEYAFICEYNSFPKCRAFSYFWAYSKSFWIFTVISRDFLLETRLL